MFAAVGQVDLPYATRRFELRLLENHLSNASHPRKFTVMFPKPEAFHEAQPAATYNEGRGTAEKVRMLLNGCFLSAIRRK